MTAAAITASCWRPPEPEPAPGGSRFGDGPEPGSVYITADGDWMGTAAGEAFLRAFDRLAAEGLHLGVNNATRSDAEQQRLWDAYLARGKRRPTVAEPGKSSHQWVNGGTAVDVDPDPVPFAHGSDESGYGGRRAEVLREEGFRDTVPGEPWHFNHLRNG